MRVLLFVLLILPQIMCGQKRKATNVLFVGNSLTYFNNLPKIVEQIGADAGITIKTTTLAKPNYALEDHWIDGELQQLLRLKTFDVIVLQQGPSSQVEGRTMLMEYGAKIKTQIDTSKTQLAYFMVWPSRMRAFDFDGVANSYTQAARKNHALLCAVGNYLREFEKQNAALSLRTADGFHPSPAGSFLAAWVIFNTIISDKYKDKIQSGNYTMFNLTKQDVIQLLQFLESSN